MANEIQLHKKNLPDNIKDIQKFILIGKEQLKAYQSKLKLIDKLDMAQDVRQQALDDTQYMGTALLWAEAKMGELLKPLSNPTASREGRRQLPKGITHKQSHYAQQLADNKDIIEEVIEEAKEHEDIPTKREVIRKIKEKKVHQNISNLKEQKVILPKNKFHTIVIDPPWPIQKIDRDITPKQTGFDYPTMTIEEIEKFNIQQIIGENCHIYLWTTQKYLPCSFAILEKWGFSYIFTMVWHKSGGFQPFNLPQYNCEFVLFGKKGSLPFMDLKNFFCCFNGKRREHSRKPDEFYDLVERVSPAPRIDIFSREKRNGFEQFGKEKDLF